MKMKKYYVQTEYPELDESTRTIISGISSLIMVIISCYNMRFTGKNPFTIVFGAIGIYFTCYIGLSLGTKIMLEEHYINIPDKKQRKKK